VDRARAEAQANDAKATRERVRVDAKVDTEVVVAEQKAYVKKMESACETAITAAEANANEQRSMYE
jgi:hypothetical protein